MGRISADVVGLDEVLNMLDQQGMLEERVPTALKKGAKVICKVAISKAPVRTGELKRSIRVGRRKKSAGDAIEVGVFYPDAAHAHLVEHGHGGPKPAPAYPFLEPAADETMDEVYDEILKELMRG